MPIVILIVITMMFVIFTVLLTSDIIKNHIHGHTNNICTYTIYILCIVLTISLCIWGISSYRNVNYYYVSDCPIMEFQNENYFRTNNGKILSFEDYFGYNNKNIEIIKEYHADNWKYGINMCNWFQPKYYNGTEESNKTK